MDNGSESNTVDILFIEGPVTDTEGHLLKNAKVEIWHANGLGNYSFFDKSQSDFNLRLTIFTDENGQYIAQTTMPVGYGCPPDDTTQALLNQLGHHGQRPSHVHYFISAPNYRELKTQFNIEDDEYLWDNFAFATREDLTLQQQSKSQILLKFHVLIKTNHLKRSLLMSNWSKIIIKHHQQKSMYAI